MTGRILGITRPKVSALTHKFGQKCETHFRYGALDMIKMGKVDLI